MRYLLLPLMALALNVASTNLASADRGGHGGGHGGHRGWSFGGHHPAKAKSVPELDGSALPAALTLLAGTSVILMNRRRNGDAAAR